MQVEHSNFSYTQEARTIPATCPKDLRAKIEAAREQRTKPVTNDVEGWDLLKKVCASLSEGQ